MAQRKKRPVLYEVVSRSQRGRRRPPVQQPSPQPEPPQGKPEHPPAEVAAPTPEPVRPEPRPASASPASSTSTSGAGFTLTLGWPHFVIGGTVLIVLLLAAFQIGRSSALPAETPTYDLDELGLEPPVETAERREPTPNRQTDDVATPLGVGQPDDADTSAQEPLPDPEPTEPPFAFVPGKYYVVVQYFPRSKERAATAARDFLVRNGVDAVLQRRKRDLLLATQQGFDSRRRAQSLMQEVRDIGKEYAKTGSGYDFSDSLVQRF